MNSKNKILAINSLAVPILTYSFSIINWTLAEIKRIDTKTRKLLTCNRAHHPKADIDRIYLGRSDGGRGLLQAEMSYKLTIIGLHKYLQKTEDWMMKCVSSYESKKKLYSIKNKAEEFTKELDIKTIACDDDKSAINHAKVEKVVAKKAAMKKLQTNWKEKPLHGKFFERASQADVSQKHTFSWLKSSGLKAETEGFIIAAQDQSLRTKNYQAKIMKTQEDPKCRFCNQYNETIDHLVSACPTLAKTEYLIRHNKVAQYIHHRICQHYGISVKNHWYEHEVAPVMENNKVKILWDFSMQTDKTIKANRPDLVIEEKEKKTLLLLDVSIPADKNTSLKTFEKLSKYQDLAIELERSWKLKTKTVPVIIGALGVVNRNTLNYIKQIPGDISIDELQKITLLGTSSILRKALSVNAI